MAEPKEGIRQEITEAQYAATSATGNATIQITNYYYREEPKSESESSAQANEAPCPYKGLFHFGPDDAALFFGRDAVVESLHQAIQTRAFLPLLGASGSGKSSVVLAGLVPLLQREGHWRFTHFRPGANPFHALALALVPLYAPQLNATERMAQARQLAGFLCSGELPLADVLAQVQQNFPGERVLLIADQFEELYTLSADDSVRRPFLDALLAGFTGPGNPTQAPTPTGDRARLVLTMRADFLGNALSYRPFADLLQHGDFKLGPMNAAELREVIEKPSAARSVVFESGLVERILEEVESEPGILPLLEFALTELWASREHQTITHGAYTAIGGVEGALARHADACYRALNPSEQQEARRVFIQLVRPGEGTEDTRRQATRKELGEARWPLARRLADDRLVMTSRNAAGDDIVEVVHETLIRHWGELRGWLAADRDFRAWQERLRASLAQWRATAQDESGLLRGAALAESRERLRVRAVDLSTAEREFIEDSAAAADEGLRRERRRRRLVFGGLAGGLTVVSVAFLLAWGQLVRAQRQRGEALALSAKFTLASRPADALFEALAAAGFSRYGSRWFVDTPLPSSSAEALLEGLRRNREHDRLLGQQREVLSAAFSADGGRIVSVGKDGSLQVWDGTSGKPVGQLLRGHWRQVLATSFDGDGGRVLGFGDDWRMRVWDATSGKALGEPLGGQPDVGLLTPHVVATMSAAFSGDGERIVSAGADGTVRLWDGRSGKALGEPLRGHQGPVWSAAFSRDGSRIVSAGADGTVRLWDATSRKALGEPLRGHQGDVRSASFSRDGDLIVSAGADGTVRVWEAKSGKAMGDPLRGHQGFVFWTSFSSDGGRIVSAGEDSTVRLWDVRSGKALGEPLRGHQGWVLLAGFIADGVQIVSLGEDGTIRVWEARSGNELDQPLRGHQGRVVSASFSSDRSRIVSSGDDGTVRMWDARSGKALGEPLRGHQGLVRSAAFSRDGSRIVSAGADGTVRLWDARSGKALGKPLRGHQGRVLYASFSRDGSRIVSAGDDGTVRVWEARTGKALGEPLRGHRGGVRAAAFSVDGERIVSAGNDRTVRVWDARSGMALGEPLRGHKNEVSSVSFSGDGARILSSGWDGSVRLWDARSGKALGDPLRGHQGRVWAAAFSSDGSRIVSAGADGTVRLWDAKSRKAVGDPLRGHQGPVFSASFSANGDRILSAGQDGTLRLWDSAMTDPIRLVCRSLRDHQSLAAPTNDVEWEARRTCKRWGWR